MESSEDDEIKLDTFNKSNPVSIIEEHKNTPQNILLKIIIAGNAGIGKTSLFESYCDSPHKDIYLNNSYIATLGVDFKIKYVDVMTYFNHELRYTTCKLQLWDTAGKEQFRPIVRSYYVSSNICILCFDSSIETGPNSMESIINWLEDVNTNCELNNSNQTYIYVIGTQFDKFSFIDIDSNIDNELVDKINSQPNTQFLGFTSSKNNIFIPYDRKSLDPSFRSIMMDIISDSNDKYSNNNKSNNNKSNNSKSNNSKSYDINTMFKIILRDYLENAVYTKDVDIKTYESDSTKIHKWCDNSHPISSKKRIISKTTDNYKKSSNHKNQQDKNVQTESNNNCCDLISGWFFTLA